jgi:hypothetical protein
MLLLEAANFGIVVDSLTKLTFMINLPDTTDFSGTAERESATISDREMVAKQLPFGLRAWWLRDFEETSDLSFGTMNSLSVPIYCLHSDPLCDVGNMDSALT